MLLGLDRGGRRACALLAVLTVAACGSPAATSIFDTASTSTGASSSGGETNGGGATAGNSAAGTKAMGGHAGTGGSSQNGGTAGTVAGGSGNAGSPLVTPEACTKACAGVGECRGAICVITCDAAHPCNELVKCPAGVPCQVACTGQGSCSSGIDCQDAASCGIQCSGASSCSGSGEPGGFDLQGLLQQAQQMQEQLESAQERLVEARVDGTVAGGSVTVTVNGIGELQAVKIRPGGFDGTSEDDLSDLGDLIVAAYRDAKSQADTLAGDALGPLSGGGMPGMPGLGG